MFNQAMQTQIKPISGRFFPFISYDWRCYVVFEALLGAPTLKK